MARSSKSAFTLAADSPHVIDLANGGEVMDFNADYDLPADVKSLALDTVKGIVDGTIVIEFAE